MAQTLVLDTGVFSWLDVVDPSRDELEELAKVHHLHPALVHDSLDPEHLPKFESAGKQKFLILRGYDEAAVADADTVQELTRKVAVFITGSSLITIHRKSQPYLAQCLEVCKLRKPEGDMHSRFVVDLVRAVLISYQAPIGRALDEFEKLEMGVFGAPGAKPFEIGAGYFLKRKAFVFKRMVRLLSDLLPKLASELSFDAQEFQDLREEAEHLYFDAEELMESINSLLNLYLSFESKRTNEASHRINEVVRVLTIFSVFLLPLNVLTGIYGMNFEHMPELKWRLGYPAVLLSMVAVTSAVYLWFRKKGWLK